MVVAPAALSGTHATTTFPPDNAQLPGRTWAALTAAKLATLTPSKVPATAMVISLFMRISLSMTVAHDVDPSNSRVPRFGCQPITKMSLQRVLRDACLL